MINLNDLIYGSGSGSGSGDKGGGNNGSGNNGGGSHRRTGSYDGISNVSHGGGDVETTTDAAAIGTGTGTSTTGNAHYASTGHGDEGDGDDQSHSHSHIFSKAYHDSPQKEEDSEEEIDGSVSSEDDYDFDAIDQTLSSPHLQQYKSSWLESSSSSTLLIHTLRELYTPCPIIDTNDAATTTATATAARTAVDDDARQMERQIDKNMAQITPVAAISAGRKRCVEWDQIRARWKRRRYDYRDEEDIGHAVQARLLDASARHRYTQSSPPSLPPELDSMPKTNESTQLPVEQLEAMDDENSVGRQLLESQPKTDNHNLYRGKEMLPSYAETLTPWDYGQFLKPKTRQRGIAERATPEIVSSTVPMVPLWYPIRKTSLGLGTSTASYAPQSRLSLNQNEQPAVYTVRTFKKAALRTGRERRDRYQLSNTSNVHMMYSDFPLQHVSQVTPSVSLLYPRLAFRAVARHLIGNAAAVDVDVDHDIHRSLQIIWKLHRRVFMRPTHTNQVSTPPNNWSRAAMLSNHTCRRQGQALWAWFQYTWNDSRKVARILGVIRQDNDDIVVGVSALPDLFIGTSMASSTDYRVRHQLRKVVTTHGLERVQWESNHANSTSSPLTTALSKRMKMDMEPGDARLMPPGSPLVTVATRYCFVPATRPPLPFLPLDATGIVFGPTDRYEHVLSQGAIDESVYKLTLSTLLMRVAKLG